MDGRKDDGWIERGMKDGWMDDGWLMSFLREEGVGEEGGDCTRYQTHGRQVSQ